MFALLKRTFLILIGFLLITVFIWNVGPYFGFGPYRPLEPVSARLIAIGVVVGFWLLARLVKRLRSYRASDKLLAAVVAQPQPESARLPPDVLKLRERFEEAVAALRQQRRGGHSLYDLPWYVIIGAPGSGKTTALLNSGLKFPLEQRVGKGALRGVGGTRNCDWWFTDEAIFLDTAGRYTTQDSDATSDSSGWSEFLALLKKYRARRPINGVILTINAQDLITQGATAREAHVEAAHRRLDELNRELRIQLPVYLMVTKCDLVAGFAEYFDDLTPQARAQVWGVTFPYDQTLRNESPEAFPEEFDALMARLNERVFERIQEARDPRRRTRVFAFPQQMAAMRDALSEFVTEVFASSHFNRQILLRGVYFTSGTQDGTPIDRLLGSIGRRFGASDAVVASSGPGKAYFVEQLLKDVLIGESGLAGVNLGLEARKAAVQLGAYAATGLVAATGVAALSVSYNRNRGYLEQTATEIAAFERTRPVTPTSSLEQIVPRLDALGAIVESADRYRDSTTWVMRWGLYQGGSIGNSANDAYLRELDTILLPRLAAQIQSRLGQSSAEPEKLFEYFMGYLMLGDPGHLNKAHLQMLADLEWKNSGAAPSPLGLALSKHFHNLLANSGSLRPLALDGKLVAQARSSLRLTSMPKMMYDSIRREYADDEGRGLRIDAVAGLDAEKVFKRRSGIPLEKPMPRLFTREVFRQITNEGRAKLVERLAKDAWVWGDNAASTLAGAGFVTSAVTDLYEADYIREWDLLLNDLQFASFRTIAETRDALGILTGPNSPLRGILRVVRENTALVEAPKTPSTGVLEAAKEAASKAAGRLAKPFQDAVGRPSVAPGSLVAARFDWVRQLTAGEAGKTPLDDIIRTIAEIQQQLGPEAAGADPAEVLATPTFRGLMLTLRQQAEALPPGLRTLVAQIGENTKDIVISEGTNQIESRYREQVLPACRLYIANRYPFVRGSQEDVRIANFETMFGHEGVFDKFFTDYLEKQVDTARIPWTWREGSVSPSRRLLEQFEAAQRVRAMFFPPGSKTAQLKFSVTMRDLDPDATRFVLQIDGQMIEEKHLPPVSNPLVWPGAQSGQATITFTSRFFDPPKGWGGPWAWFRLIDDTVVGTADPENRIRLKVKTAKHHIDIIVGADGGYTNPFASDEWRQFSCES